MKSTAVDESLSNTSTDVLFQKIPTNYKIKCIMFSYSFARVKEEHQVVQ